MRRITPSRRAGRARTRGQSMVEYMVVAGIAATLLFFPIQGKASVVELMLDSVRIAYTKFLSAISIPQ